MHRRREWPGMSIQSSPALRRLCALRPPADWYAIPLRLIVGYGFMEHGWAKLARGPEHFAAILNAIGTPFPHLMAWATVMVELLGGLAVLAGAFVPLAAAPMAVVLVVAIITVHLPNGFSSIKLQSFSAASGAHFGQPGYETDLLYLAGLAALAVGGPGPWSVGRWLGRRTPFPLEGGRVGVGAEPAGL
jgi:putative oxidoreductase